jgi:1,4-dihydroxy-2-naphthoate octaprenyltransferase
MNRWIIGARPRTLPAAIVPVAVGAGAAVGIGDFVWWRVGAALVVSLALQVGVNYANDYSDLDTSMWLLVVGVAAIAAAWFYTGGPKPYGYLGLGELFVFVFFGLVATAGTTYAAIAEITGLSIVLGCAVGSLACALLVINNLRDIPTDAKVGKKTLAVRLGDRRTRWFYVALVVAAFALLVVAAVAWRMPALLGLLAVPLAWAPCRIVLGSATGPALIPVLGATGRLQMAFGLATTIGLALGG